MAFNIYPAWSYEAESAITNFVNTKAGSEVISIHQTRADKLFLIQKINELAGSEVLKGFDRHNIIKIIQVLDGLP